MKQQEAIIKEQQHQVEIERKQQEIKFEIDRKDQEYCLRMKKIRLEMKRLSEENRIKVAQANIVEIEYLEEAEIDQHLELAFSVDRRSDSVNDWVDDALENQKVNEVVPSSLKFANCINTESGSHQHRNVSTAGTLTRPSSPIQTLGCDEQGCYLGCYPYQPTVSFSDGNGIKHGVSTNPAPEEQSLPISNNAAFYENNTSSFFNSAVTAANNTRV